MGKREELIENETPEKIEEKSQINKVVYFDEGSATDLMQIVEGGELTKTTNLINESKKGNETETSATVSASLGISALFKALVGLSGEASAHGEISKSTEATRMVENILKNTILTDFVEFTNEQKINSGIELFEEYSLTVPEDSFTYMAMVSPYMTMMNATQSIPASSFEISIDKIDTAIKMGKGYYELLGSKIKTSEEKGENKRIFRFNIDSFKNNYRISDLIKMRLVLYAVKVGEASIDSLNFDTNLA